MRLDGEQLRRARVTAGFSQAALAERAGVATNTVQRLEYGQGGFTPATLRKLADALGVEAGVLVAWDDAARATSGDDEPPATDAPDGDEWVFNRDTYQYERPRS